MNTAISLQVIWMEFIASDGTSHRMNALWELLFSVKVDRYRNFLFYYWISLMQKGHLFVDHCKKAAYWDVFFDIIY